MKCFPKEKDIYEGMDWVQYLYPNTGISSIYKKF